MDDYHGAFINQDELSDFGLTLEMIRLAITHVHEVLDRIDRTLLDHSGRRLSSMIELANLSAVVGNLFRDGIGRHSGGAFVANAPHTYPDLLGRSEGASDIEIKVALGTNKPKGHLVKPGPHLIVRYVLLPPTGPHIGISTDSDRVVWLWEVKVGPLHPEHFSFSNTPGDSGKTAPVNAAGMRALAPVFIDLEKCPYSPNGTTYRDMQETLALREVSRGHRRLAF